MGKGKRKRNKRGEGGACGIVWGGVHKPSPRLKRKRVCWNENQAAAKCVMEDSGRKGRKEKSPAELRGTFNKD